MSFAKETLLDEQRREAAQQAAALVESGMRVGLGTGRTVAWLLPALAERRLAGLRCVATSPETEQAAKQLGLPLEPFSQLDRLDIAIDGADQVAPDRWAIKGGHGAHLREKIVAFAADRFVVIVSSEKLVDRLRAPVPLELHRFGMAATVHSLPEAKLRGDTARSPDGGVLADYEGAVDDPASLSAGLDAHPGIAAHGLFGPQLIDDVIATGGTP
jgi:ribose 5-phosphate isomerase A